MEDGTTAVERDTLLIVDDDVEWTDLLQIFFAAKYDVHVANEAEAAIDFVKTSRPRAMILDLVMPSIDGFGLMHRINEMFPGGVPTVLTTGWRSSDVEACAALVGCSAVLCKPISLPELDAVVSSLINQGARNSRDLKEPEAEGELQ